MKVGDPFNPYKLFNGIYIPFSLAEITELSSAAKLAYGRLTAYAGRNGRAFPKQEAWAKACGFKSRTPLKRAIKELIGYGLIRVVKPQGSEIVNHKNDAYEFLWHSGLAESLKNSPMDDSSHPDGWNQPPTMDDSSHRIYEEKNHIKKINKKDISKKSKLPSKTFELTEELIDWGASEPEQWTADEMRRHAGFFKDYMASNAKTYKDPAAAFRNCVRGNWAKLRQKSQGGTFLQSTAPITKRDIILDRNRKALEASLRNDNEEYYDDIPRLN